ncbi:MAG: hypothetical protein IAF94_25595 [Pirellulaceae bacterium]|nr:hypothetical protein [Pirellulaceae bacterium]
MAIEFPCPHCAQLLRVGDDSAGKTAKCPKCNGLASIPAGDAGTAPGFSGGSPFGAPLPSSYGPPTPGSSGEAPAAKNPYSDAGAASNPFGSQPGFGGGSAPSINPYASPGTGYQPPAPDVAINPQVVGFEPIWNYAWLLWQQNLLLLLGVTVTIIAVSYVISFLFMIPQFALEQNGEREAAQIVNGLGAIVSNVVQIFLGIGQAQIALKMARRQPTQYTDLFGGGPLFLPVLGASILGGIAFALGFLLLIIPGVLLLLMWWPYYYLVVDRKAGVIESFSVAAKVTQGNWGTAFLLWLASVGIMILGCFALCIGVLFAAPLVTMLFAVAYLMMSGLIPVQPAYGQLGQFGQPTPKW